MKIITLEKIRAALPSVDLIDEIEADLLPTVKAKQY